jgi:pantoate--beta-alanine ligase
MRRKIDMPLITTTVEETRRQLRALRTSGKSIGLVPTMGALHEGHASLLRQARRSNDVVVASIFVNPTQFAPNEDLSRYPRPFEKDVAVCAAEGVDLIFHPEPGELYPPNFQTYVEVEKLQRPLCGKSRPTHFRGVATVVLKLFQIIQPDRAYFGQKDAQQARLLMQMVRDLDVPVEMVLCPIVRESDGLALSSRNQYLTAEQRRHAPALYDSLQLMQTMVAAGERGAAALRDAALERLNATPGARIDYLQIVGWETLEPIDIVKGEVLFATAVYFGSTRLIDNWRTTVA